MATIERAPRRGSISTWVVGATVVATVMAVLPILIAALAATVGGGTGGPRTAFASAAPGAYAVVARNEMEADVVAVVPGGGGEPVEVARVPHLPGMASSGAVSPEGRRLALVTADAGTPAHPTASLLVLDLETGALHRLANGIDPLQTPAWASDGQSIVATRTVERGAGDASVTFLGVGMNGDEATVLRLTGVLGGYPVGFDTGGRFVAVVIDGRGSTVLRDGVEVAFLGRQITRDWKLSADGSQLAYIESNVDSGLRYVARVTSLEPSAGGVSAQVLDSNEGQQLGVAWKPGGTGPTFGREPGSAAVGEAGVSAQAATEAADGFDVPLAYDREGRTLAVEHWSGRSFAEAGRMGLQLVSDDGHRAALPAFARFYGWAAR